MVTAILRAVVMKKQEPQSRFSIKWFHQLNCRILTFALVVSTWPLWALPDEGPFVRPKHDIHGWITCTHKETQPDHSRPCSAPLCYYSSATKVLSSIFLIITTHAFFAYSLLQKVPSKAHCASDLAGWNVLHHVVLSRLCLVGVQEQCSGGMDCFSGCLRWSRLACS